MMQEQNTRISGLSLSLLGSFAVTVDGKPVNEQLPETLRALLSYLVVESDREHPRAVLAAILWPELSEREALSSLRFAISNLRGAIGDRTATPPYLCISRETIRFNLASNHRLDIALLQEAKKTLAIRPLADLQRLCEAVSNYRGDFLAGFTCHSTVFEEWVMLKREQFHRAALNVMYRLAERYLQLGDYDKAEHHASRQLELDPWREEAHGQLMRALALSGQRSAAIAQYETCRRLLFKELSVEPGDEINALYVAICDGRLSPQLIDSDHVQGTEVVRHSPSHILMNIHHNGRITYLGSDPAEQLSADMPHSQEHVSHASAIDSLLEAWTRAVDLRDGHPVDHSRHLADMTVWLARGIGMDNRDLIHVRRGAMLHDVGIEWIPESILRKPGPLTEDDWKIIRQHPGFARTQLAPIALLRPALDIPLFHHERWDGTGYPVGLRAEELPLMARVFAVIDVWITLGSDRPYRKAWSRDRALQYLLKQAGAQFDPSIVEAFVSLLPHLDSLPVLASPAPNLLDDQYEFSTH